jgi:hypothetical protein
MDKAKTTRNQQQTPSQPLAGSVNKATVGYPAVTRFAQVPAPSADGGNTLPHQLRQDVEALSGVSMAGTSVHYNSSAPAQIGVFAYAVGSQIHLGPGQERHLPHEAWHVVQQKQGRVKPTLQAKGLAINDDQGLEAEADVMGQHAAQLKTTRDLSLTPSALSVSESAAVLQRKIGFEFQAVNSIFLEETEEIDDPLGIEEDEKFAIETDGSKHELELVTKAVDETGMGRKELVDIMDQITLFLDHVEDYGAVGNAPMINWDSEILEKAVLHKILLTEYSDAKAEGDVRRTYELEEQLDDLPRFVVKRTKHFHPQATVGVKFENIAKLIEYASRAPVKKGGVNAIEPHEPERKDVSMPTAVPEIIQDPQTAANVFGWGAKTYQEPYKKAWAAASDEINKIPGLTPKVKGLAAIFLGLVKNRSENIGNPKYMKYIMPFMLRNGFMPFFNSLNTDERKQLEEIDTEGWKTNIMPPTKEGEDMKNPTVKKIFDNMLGINGEPRFNEEKKGERKVRSEDLLQNIGGTGHGTIKDNKESLDTFGMARIDDIGHSDTETAEQRHGALIELRKLGSEVPANKLKEFALAVFDLIVLINASSSAPPPSSSSASSSSSSSVLLSSSPPSV